MLEKNRIQILKILWLVVISLTPILLTSAVIFDIDISIQNQEFSYVIIFSVLVLAAFFAEYVDASIGMGFGTILTPSLIILGYQPLQAIPPILLSTAVVGIVSGLFHHRIGNTDLAKGSDGRKNCFALIIFSIIGFTISASLAIILDPKYIKFYIAIMIFLIGMALFIKHNKHIPYSIKKVFGLGFLAGFNKGFSGGGYGAITSGGQVLLGISEKKAIGVTLLAEGLTSLFGMLFYSYQLGFPDWQLTAPLIAGGAFSIPAGSITVKHLPKETIRRVMGIIASFLGILFIVKMFL